MQDQMLEGKDLEYTFVRGWHLELSDGHPRGEPKVL
jgi:hypothetical protein